MSRKIPTLYELCLQRTARLLKNHYWNPELPLNQNPFASLPSAIIDELVIVITRISTSEQLFSSHLRLLSTSGRVREFILDENEDGELIFVDDEDLQRILEDVTSAGSYLITVQINVVPLDERNLHTITAALNCLLCEARNVKHVESFIKFDLRIICNCVQLEKLILHFPHKNCVDEFLEVTGGVEPHTNLKHIEVRDYWALITDYDTAVVLQHCTQLTSINVDISRSLTILHSAELYNGTLTHQYKVQKCHFGHDGPSDFNFAASREGVLIASVTCPFLNDVDLIVDDNRVFSALTGFRNLTTLSIKWKSFMSGDYMLGVQSLLEKPEIGHKLKSLALIGFTNVDFSSVGLCCPNLEVLTALRYEECTRSGYASSSFRKLKSFILFMKSPEDCKDDTLIGILSNATDLESLYLDSGVLTDRVLENVLKENSLSKLKSIVVDWCNLSLHGLQSLASSLTAFEYFHIKQSDLSFEEIEDVFRNVNPQVIVRTPLQY